MAAMAEKGWRLISTNRSNAVLLLFWESALGPLAPWG